jgi:hypothetical protein
MMPDDAKTKPVRRRRRRATDRDESSSSDKVAKFFLTGMAVVALACLGIGTSRHDPDPVWFLRSLSYLILGIAFVAIGLLELEWLERIVWIVEVLSFSIFFWIAGWWSGSLSESELVGRRRAVVLWVLAGVPVFAWGCLAALRVV